MNWNSIGLPAVTIVCLVIGMMSLKRGLKLKQWLPMKGRVIGPATHLDTSAVRIEFTDPLGVNHQFESNIRFGHSAYAKSCDRLPFKENQEIKILVNPSNYNDAEIETSLYHWLGFALIGISLYFANQFLA